MILKNDENVVVEFLFKDGLHQTAKKHPYKKYKDIFTRMNQYKNPTGFFEKGWFYAYFRYKFFSGFIAIGFDKREQIVFHEIRYKGKTYKPGFGLGKVKFCKNHLELKDSKRRLRWSGKFPNIKITFEVGEKGGSTKFEYEFRQKKLRGGVMRPLRHFFSLSHKHVKETPRIYWLSTWADVTVKITSIGKTSMPKEIIGKIFKTKLGYTENVHVNSPLISGGWHWHNMFCFQTKKKLNEGKLDKYISFMEVFLHVLNKKIILSSSFVIVDGKTGDARFFFDNKSKIKWENKKPIVKICSKDRQLALDVDKPVVINKYLVKGIKIFKIVPDADIEYLSYDSSGEVRYKDKTYMAVGTTELVGQGLSFWL
ncbi:MAG: hypothetical protein DRP08_00635 [Candidatus Aenigmatarchaeota archaeon]|nr:MAG: hypothetical protein DRP08_00635 [Candidatus Aenigmarchaeota archaeon]